MKKYTAIIDKIDNDYRAFCGNSKIQVDSWDEARDWTTKKSWSGYDYYVNYLIDNSTKAVHHSRSETLGEAF